MTDILSRQRAKVQPVQLERQRRVLKLQKQEESTAQRERSKYFVTDKGEYVERRFLRGLSPEQIRELKRKGIDQFQKDTQAKIEAESVLLDTGERVSKDAYKKLSKKEREQLKVKGLDKYIAETTIKLSTGEIIDKSIFTKLPQKYKELLQEQGIEKYNEYIEKEVKPLLKKRQDAQKELAYYRKLDRALAFRGYALAYKPKIVPLYDNEGNIVDYHVRKGYFPRPESRIWVKMGETTWYAVGQEIKDKDGNVTEVNYDYKSKITPDKYNSLRPELKDRYVMVTVHDARSILKKQAGLLFELNRDLPEGYEILPGATQHIKGLSIQNVTVTDPDGKKYGGDLQTIYKQFKDEGKVTEQKYVYPPSPISLKKLGIKYNYINPYTMKTTKKGIYGTNSIRFKYKGKEIIMNELDAPKLLTIVKKIDEDKDSKYKVVTEQTVLRIVDKDTGKPAFKSLAEAYNQIMTDGQYNPYVSPFTGMVRLPGLISIYTGDPSALGGAWGDTPTVVAKGFTGVRYFVSTPTGLRAANAEEIKEAQRLTREAIALQEYMKPPTAAELIGAGKVTTSEALREVGIGKPMIKQPIIRKEMEKYNIVKTNEGRYYVELKNNTYVELRSFEQLPETLRDKAYNEGIDSIYVKTYDKIDGEYEYLRIDDFDKLSGSEKEAFKTGGVNSLAAVQVEKEIGNELQQVNREIAILENKDRRPFYNKIDDVLSANLTNKEIISEILSFGGAQTALDTDKIRLSYLKERKTALEQGMDLTVSEDEYVKEVKENQPTLKELGLRFVPFEYVRPDRWQELHTWEKVVYPALDIMILIPVVGWSAKGISVVTKATSTGAKIAAQGGTQAAKFAAIQATRQLEKGAAELAIKRSLVQSIAADLKAATKVNKSVIQKAYQAAAKDVSLAEKEFTQASREVKMLQHVAAGADKYVNTAGTKLYRVAAGAEERLGTIARTTAPVADVGISGVIVGSTVRNWEDLTASQKIVGLTLATLTMGLPGKAFSAVEIVTNPYRIPKTALSARKAMTRPIPGEIFKSDEGTVRLVLDKSIGTPEQARLAVAELNRQLQSGERVATAMYGDKKIKIRGTGSQKILGEGTEFTGTPMGETYRKGTGRFGAKSNLEQYLEQIHKQGIDYNVKGTATRPGVEVAGKEGGIYVAPVAYTQFSFKTSYGQTGDIASVIAIGTPGLNKLPKSIRYKSIKKLEDSALKLINEGKLLNQSVEGFKQYRKFMELENVITNQSRLQRVQNLRSNLADKLHMKKGEYFTRDKRGKIEIFQMYLEGGRTTPYTLKELYQLKGEGLRNALEDIFYGLGERVNQLTKGKGKAKIPETFTKEEEITKLFNYLDNEVRFGRLARSEADRLKTKALNRYRTIRVEFSRERIRQDIARTAAATTVRETRIPEDNVVRQRLQEYIDTRAKERQAERRIEAAAVRPTTKTRPDTTAKTVPITRIPGTARETRVPRESIRPVPRTTPRTTPRVTPRTTERVPPRVPPRTPPPKVPPRIPRIPPGIPPKIPPPTKPPFILKGDKEIRLTHKEAEGLVAWRQGLFYIAIYPPYDRNHRIYSRKQFEGVPIETGIGSAARSIITKSGKVPTIMFDMGIQDVKINPTKGGAKPVITFNLDRKRRTTHARGKLVSMRS